MRLPGLEAIERAQKIVYSVMPPTPQYSWPLLNERVGAEVWVKHENHTPLGAFKIRGGLVYMDWLRSCHPQYEGVICATRGNFGQAVTLAARRNGLNATVVVPFGNSREKNRAMKGLGADLIEHGHDFQEANEFAEASAASRGLHHVPSFHELLVHGTATAAHEFLRGTPVLDVVYLGIGQGSAICGMMAARDALRLKTRVVGVVSAGAPAYSLSFKARQSVSHPVTTRLADGLACRKPDEAAVELVLAGVDRIIEVTEDEVAASMRALYQDTHNLAEGAGAAALAGLLQERESVRGKRVGVLLSGGNVDAGVFAEVLNGM